MSTNTDSTLLDALLDSWDRNNRILVNLLRAVPDDCLDLRPIESSPSIAQLCKHMYYCRLVFAVEDAPEFAEGVLPNDEWRAVHDRELIAQMLDESAVIVRNAVAGRVAAGRAMDVHYDHPILLLQHMIWHEGYHHGQIKLTLRLAGRPFDDEEIGAVTWDVWMDKT
ncbi:MAG: damage-inducible protein DinB [Gemmatimonadaceae bacterium]|nr:damage-inducible protein DinB [Gemmatimonadaceae bacterium]